MLNNFESQLSNWLKNKSPWTNVYGLSRTLLALSTLLTLVFNDAKVLFIPTSDNEGFPTCEGLGNISLYCLVPDEYLYLNLVRVLSILLLIVVVSGWRPRFTGIIHWYVSFSFLQSAVTVDGGDSIAAVMTLLLIPLTLTDPRKSHWDSLVEKKPYSIQKLVGEMTLLIIRIQVAIIYFHATVAKLTEDEWINGTAVWYYAQNSMLGLNPHLFDIFSNLLSSFLIVIPTWGTLILQTFLFAGILASKEKRKTLLWLAIFMHEIFAIFLGLMSFSLAMIAILIIYFRPTEEAFNFSSLKKYKLNFKGVKNV